MFSTEEEKHFTSCKYNQMIHDITCGENTGLQVEMVNAHYGSSQKICPGSVDPECNGTDITKKMAEM